MIQKMCVYKSLSIFLVGYYWGCGKTTLSKISTPTNYLLNNSLFIMPILLLIIKGMCMFAYIYLCLPILDFLADIFRDDIIYF